MVYLLKVNFPAVVIPHLLTLYASQDDVRPPELVNVKVAEVAIFHGYPHFMGQPAVKVVALLAGLWLALPDRVKEGVSHLLSCPHRLIGQQPQGLSRTRLVCPYISPAGLAEVAVPVPIFPAIYPSIRTVGHRPTTYITPGWMGVYHGRPPNFHLLRHFLEVQF